jgi:hypothetical protein
MNDKYIISFVAGTSGRFLASILWNIINDATSDIQYTKFNSAHYQHPWTENWNEKVQYGSPWYVNGPDAFKKFDFVGDSNKGLITTHSYPDWEVIRQKFPTIKTIIIKYKEEDIPELIGNIMYKNGFDLTFEDKYRKSMTFQNILKIYKEIYNKDYDGHEFTLEHFEPIFNKMLGYMRPDFLSWTRFITTPIPDDFVDTTLTISYKELFNSEIILEKLNVFTGHDITDATRESYNLYVNNRNKLVKEKMPWLI